MGKADLSTELLSFVHNFCSHASLWRIYMYKTSHFWLVSADYQWRVGKFKKKSRKVSHVAEGHRKGTIGELAVLSYNPRDVIWGSTVRFVFLLDFVTLVCPSFV